MLLALVGAATGFIAAALAKTCKSKLHNVPLRFERKVVLMMVRHLMRRNEITHNHYIISRIWLFCWRTTLCSILYCRSRAVNQVTRTQFTVEGQIAGVFHFLIISSNPVLEDSCAMVWSDSPLVRKIKFSQASNPISSTCRPHTFSCRSPGTPANSVWVHALGSREVYWGGYSILHVEDTSCTPWEVLLW